MYAFRAVETHEELRACRRIRYSVYCERKGWLAAGRHATQEESDDFDAGSEHFAALDATGRIVGTVRLILASRLLEPLPITHHPAVVGAPPPTADSAEISRLCVSAPARNFNIELGLYRLIYRACKSRRLAHCYIVVDATFLDLLNRLGFGFVPLGPPTDYFGGRTVPARCDPADVDAGLRVANPALYEWLQEPPSRLEGTRLLQRFLVRQRGHARDAISLRPLPLEVPCPSTSSSSSGIPAMSPLPFSSGSEGLAS
ncbi:MAG TPA: GNAT family N-acyltransferase [Anaeromyxobacter sp.]